ncbi:hypothetical protein BCV72DRAFT_319646 [Rhizopus microsporus var. microsporus]|uniref:Uncharacterized protein n=1 Tax=Rhizopus microsporus var. microsporus TaxID=86635 RepID=A0A1X0QQG7_RHIZD|nr:hypothetical protein BCV72DRAFT_319646 [Rhizopus microsporus var. microsporus]
MNFRTNGVFLDESAFHINLKRSMAWSKKKKKIACCGHSAQNPSTNNNDFMCDLCFRFNKV